MFAYDYDRQDATIGEQAGRIRLRLDNPSGYCPFPGGICFPSHMRDYDPTPPKADVHFNGTILSHAYFLYAQVVGQETAGRVLQRVPAFLSPRPTFREVAQAFYESARTFGGIEKTGPAIGAFQQVGLTIRTHT
jgi:Zn-dependent metalloprotease